ncbi:MAG TPA: alpha-glucosidase/alpha-galactosidase [Lentisphaeria bacterium]|nr:MAG: alpha-glucosidase/alpha-galactosidase [Lentisphaerae bacterium GWF2_49_21]HBC89463.1 alpha-glucosidase/alpha-galactosidase [Lentisphaeria bacterium]
MARIAFIGAGSFGFTRTLVKDILTFPILKDSTIVLMDIHKERLTYITKAVNKIVAAGNYPAKVEATMDRATALKGADAVICTILSGEVDVWRYDIEIPKKYGVDTNIGDTRGPSGIFRALRTLPVMLSICKDIERYCPNAIFLNYTNPMAMLCHGMQKTSKVTVSGLCHSVQGTAGMIAKWVGVPSEELDYVCAGINHQAWYLKLKHKHKDLYPKLNKVVRADKKIYNEEQVRNEMFIHLGYYVTESSGHNSEYNAWFRKRPDLIKKYCTSGTGWNPGEYGYILKGYSERNKNRKWQKDIEAWLKKPDIDIKRGHEYAAFIINAWMGGDLFKFNGNVPNKGLITNLPYDACVEVPVVAGRNKLDSVHVGALPPQLAALNNISVAIENMTVDASLTGNAEMVYHAIAYDPLTSAVLSLSEIRKMVQEMLYKNKAYLPQFRNLKIS